MYFHIKFTARALMRHNLQIKREEYITSVTPSAGNGTFHHWFFIRTHKIIRHIFYRPPSSGPVVWGRLRVFVLLVSQERFSHNCPTMSRLPSDWPAAISLRMGSFTILVLRVGIYHRICLFWTDVAPFHAYLATISLIGCLGCQLCKWLCDFIWKILAPFWHKAIHSAL